VTGSAIQLTSDPWTVCDDSYHDFDLSMRRSVVQPRAAANYVRLLQPVIMTPLWGGGIEGYRDPSVCLSQGAAALGAQLPRL